MKKKRGFLFTFVLFTLLYLVLPLRVKAAVPGKVTLQRDVVYKNYDITGDNKKDTIYLKKVGEWQYGYSLQIYINGKRLYTVPVKYSSGAIDSIEAANWEYSGDIITLKNGKKFLYIRGYSGLESETGSSLIFQYKNGKLKKVVDFGLALGKSATDTCVSSYKISGNSLIVNVFARSYTMGFMSVKYIYVYKDGTLKRKSSIGKTSFLGNNKRNRFTAKFNIKTYTKANLKNRSHTIKKGDIVKITHVISKNGYCCYRAVWGKKVGWFSWILNEISPDYSKVPFKEVFYAN